MTRKSIFMNGTVSFEQPLHREQAKKVLDMAEYAKYRDFVIALVILDCVVRINELLNVTVDDYNDKEKTIKRGKARKHVNQWRNIYKIEVEELESLYYERLWRLYEDDYYCTSSRLSFYENYINHIENNVLMNYLKGLRADKRFLAYSQKEVTHSNK